MRLGAAVERGGVPEAVIYAGGGGRKGETLREVFNTGLMAFISVGIIIQQEHKFWVLGGQEPKNDIYTT